MLAVRCRPGPFFEVISPLAATAAAPSWPPQRAAAAHRPSMDFYPTPLGTPGALPRSRNSPAAMADKQLARVEVPARGQPGPQAPHVSEEAPATPAGQEPASRAGKAGLMVCLLAGTLLRNAARFTRCKWAGALSQAPACWPATSLGRGSYVQRYCRRGLMSECLESAPASLQPLRWRRRSAAASPACQAVLWWRQQLGEHSSAPASSTA